MSSGRLASGPSAGCCPPAPSSPRASADPAPAKLEVSKKMGTRADLIKVADRRADVLVAEAEERVERLLHEKAERGEHGHAAVRDLGLAEHLELGDGLALREAGGVEVAHRRQRAREARHELRLVGRPALRCGGP